MERDSSKKSFILTPVVLGGGQLQKRKMTEKELGERPRKKKRPEALILVRSRGLGQKKASGGGDWTNHCGDAQAATARGVAPAYLRWDRVRALKEVCKVIAFPWSLLCLSDSGEVHGKEKKKHL